MQNKLCFTIPGSIRSKKNSKTATAIGGKLKPRRAIILSSSAYQKWESQARADFVLHHFRFPTFTNLCHVKALIFYRGPEPDLTGCLESVGDCLQGLVWENDRQIYSWDGSRKIHDKENPRTEITVIWEDGVEDNPMSQEEVHRIASLIETGGKK